MFHPFASGVPFETWIMPKKHNACFGFMDFDEAKDLGHVLKRSLAGLFELLGNPDYNIVVHTAPVNEENEDYFHWHMRIIPRLTMLAGFEIGSGIYINTALPEETAPAIKAVQL
jgi:UDPglucose--hexose-1-phosphate uridylyltransferase